MAKEASEGVIRDCHLFKTTFFGIAKIVTDKARAVTCQGMCVIVANKFHCSPKKINSSCSSTPNSSLTPVLATSTKDKKSCAEPYGASGFSELLESIFCLLLVVEVFSLQKAVQVLEEVVVGWQEVR